MKHIQNIAFITSLFCIVTFSSCQNETKKSDDFTQEDSLKNIQNSSSKSENKSENTQKTIVFFGNSLTAGYGLEPEEAFPQLIQLKLDSLNYPYKIVNAGLSGETTSGGAERIDWILKQKLDVFVLELGGNDGLRGIDTKETEKNLGIIIDKVRKKYPKAKILLTGMETPPNMGQSYTESFRKIFPKVAEEKEVNLMDFLLIDVGGIPELNQPDGIHPTAEGQRIVAKNVFEELEKLLEK
jgi:acyl-CoA thioesterase-1